MSVNLFGNIDGVKYEPFKIDLFEMAKKQNNPRIQLKDTEWGKDLPNVKLEISEEGLRALHGSRLKGSVDLEEMEKENEWIHDHQPIDSFYFKIRSMETAYLEKKENSGELQSKHSVIEKGKSILKGFAVLHDEVVRGYDTGYRVRFVADESSEDGYKKLSKEDELQILQNDFKEFIERRFGIDRQRENENVAEAINRFRGHKYYEPEKIPVDFADRMWKAAGIFIKEYEKYPERSIDDILESISI